MTMQMWMTGVEGRELYCMEAPYTTLNPDLTPGGVSSAPHPTPTLLVRQTGVNGWESPFIAVYQPVRGEIASVKTVASSSPSAFVVVSLIMPLLRSSLYNFLR